MRYRLLVPIVGQPLNSPYGVYEAGRVVADSHEAAVVGDLVWPAICASPNPAQLEAIGPTGFGLTG
jgi:hypothetical protein